MTLPPMSLVEAASVSAEKPLHSYAEIRLGRRHDEMEVRVEEAVSDAAPTVSCNGLPQQTNEDLAIPVVRDDRRAGIALRDDVMRCSGDILTRLPRHRDRIAIQLAKRESSRTHKRPFGLVPAGRVVRQVSDTVSDT